MSKEAQSKEMKRTPGEWQIRRRKDGSIGITGAYHIPPGAPAVMGGFLVVCDLTGDVHYDEGNARLISAAPDLLEACQAFVTAYEKSLQLEKTDVALRLAKAAIAKATGATE